MFGEHLHVMPEKCLLELNSLPNLDNVIVENSFNKSMSLFMYLLPTFKDRGYKGFLAQLENGKKSLSK